MCGVHPGAKTLELRNVGSIHPAGMNEFCEWLFEQMGYGPLRKFYEYADGTNSGMDHYRDYALRAAAELAENIQSAATGNGNCFAVFGHAVFLNAIAVLLCEACSCTQETFDSLMDMDLGETEGILLDIESGTIAKKMVASQGGESVVDACTASGIAQLVLINHGNAAVAQGEDGAAARGDRPHQWKKEDQLRELTEKGQQQCLQARAWSSLLPLSCVISSPARRAKDTARLMTGVDNPQIVECLHPAGVNESCEALFEQLGCGPLTKFFETERGEEHFRWYGNVVCDELSRHVAQLQGIVKPGTSMAIFGHAVFLNAVALEALMVVPGWQNLAQEMLDLDLGETEGICVNMATGTFEKREFTPPAPFSLEA
jgi:broad specificity phosphatase PhoE